MANSSGSVGTLSWSAKLDSNEFKKGVRKVKKEMKEAQKAVGESLKIMAQGFAVVTGAVTGATVALGAMVKQSADVVNSQKILADSIGATQQEIAGLELASDSMGVSYDQLIDKMREIGGIKEFEKLADDVASASSATESMKIAQEALGNEGLKLLPILQQGSAGLKAYSQEALKLGLALPEDKVNALTSAWGAFEKAMQMVRGLTRQLSAELSESFGKFFVLIQSLVTTFRTDFIKAFQAVNRGFVSFIEFTVDQINKNVIPAYIAFINAIGDVGEALEVLYDFFFDSPVSSVVNGWTDDLLLFFSTMKESLAVGFVKAFSMAFNAVSKIIKGTIDTSTKPLRVLLGLLNQAGVISDEALDKMLDKVNLLSDAFSITADNIKKDIKEIQDVLQDDLNDAVEKTFDKSTALRKTFDLSIKTGFSEFDESMAGGDGDGKDDPIKVELDSGVASQSNVIATAGSVEEFNIMRSQRKEELNILKKIADNTSKTAKNQPQPAGF